MIMLLKIFKNTVLFFVLMLAGCGSKSNAGLSFNNEITADVKTDISLKKNTQKIIVGANQTETYLPILKGKRVAVVANQTSVLFKNQSYTHIVDSLLNLNINIKKVFAPEHGFRGTADAGEIIKDGLDTKTGLPIISLYGKNKKPSAAQLKDVDIVIFDIQDVGARFYTYISSLHYVMEACAEQNIQVLVLDRPNPNGHYIDGPILEKEHQSFVGMHPVPVIHGMSIGEYAQMINGQGWLENNMKVALKVIPVKNYTRKTPYSLPIKPSPNLPNDIAINLYPSLCFFEGTNVSIGRGTEKQFQIIGIPIATAPNFDFKFTPQPNKGAKYPKHEGQLCYGYDLSHHKELSSLDLNWLIEFYTINKTYNNGTAFFTDFFTTLAGTKKLQKQIEEGMNAKEIKKTWEAGLDSYNAMRNAYLIYK
jgi:uncharacterized protein YbbC (DUF1343 family)